jgi:carboxyl-terminal processing protease
VPVEKFAISDEDYKSFKDFVKAKNFTYDRLSEKTMNTLKEVMEFEGYMKTGGEEFKALQAKLVPNLDHDLETFKPEISKLINLEIAKRYYFKRGESVEGLKSDQVTKKAIEILDNPQKYKDILSPSKSEPTTAKSLSMSLRKTNNVTMADFREKANSDMDAQSV